jgi:predicted RNA binding protein YcfA (HicA-like mRNA interferase family)
MKLPRDLDAETLIKALNRLGYSVTRQTGSHIRLRCLEPNHALTIPNHHPIRIGTLAAILLDLETVHGLDREGLLLRLFG